MKDARILIVDDDQDIQVLLASILLEAGCRVECAADGNVALVKLEQSRYDLVVTDVCMPGLDGLELLHRIHQRWPEQRVVVMTAYNTPDKVVRSLRDNALTYFSKPFTPRGVIDMVNEALQASGSPDDIEVISARPDWISLRLRCKMETADRLAHFFRELPVGLGEQNQCEIALAFRELLMNAIEHGGRSDPEEKVEVVYIRTSQAILYLVRDPGEGFSFDRLPHAAVSNAPEAPLLHMDVRRDSGMRAGGFGILLTRQIADELIYSEKGNEVLLVKFLRPR